MEGGRKGKREGGRKEESERMREGRRKVTGLMDSLTDWGGRSIDRQGGPEIP